MTSNHKKHQKYSPEWAQEITRLVGQEIEITEKEKDGQEIKKKVNDLEHLLEQRKLLIIDLETKKKVLKEKGGYTDTYVDLALRHDELEENINEWKANLKTGQNYTNQHNSFLKSGTGLTNPYRSTGWIKLMTDYYP